MKITVCKGCGNAFMAKDDKSNPACPICVGISPDSGVPLEIEIPDISYCVYCGQIAQYDIETQKWHIGNDKPSGKEGYRNVDVKELPFYRATDDTYYCGCKGWD